MIELKIPDAGESIQEVQIAQWLKEEGQWVEQDEPVAELETDKASMELPAPASGVLVKVVKKDGDVATVGEVIGHLDETAARPASQTEATPGGKLPPPLIIMPAAQRLLAEHGLQGREMPATGPDNRLLKEDVLRYLEKRQEEAAARPQAAAPPPEESPAAAIRPLPPTPASAGTAAEEREEETVPMTRIRRRIAERLVEAQHEAALLTTFNEVDMSAVVELRKRHRDAFQEKYGIRLGFMSFFVKSVIEALKACPALNAEIRDQNIVYRNYFDIGVAIGSGRGLVVPVLRNAERMSFAEIETKIADFATRAESNRILPNELEGGTFTITNGGIYGSLLSTPIVNPPQSGVLGMHAIQDRP
ncbi:MAG: dihydrolipoyllysine-residue succinyltransferase, partial [Planctomycetota bacterium]